MSIHEDDKAVNAFAKKMRAKMAKQRAKGYSGWRDCPIQHLQDELARHVVKGDPVDVANFCAMLSARGASTASAAAALAAKGE